MATVLACPVLLLTACGTSPTPVIGASPRVTGAGKHYSFRAAQVPKSQWPNPCSLLTRPSAAAAVGTSVSVKRFHTNCYYLPATADYPRLTITLLAVGTRSDRSFDKPNDSSGENAASVSGVGQAASLHKVRALTAYRLDVLTPYAHFAVTEQSPYGQRLQPDRARRLLAKVGRAVAKAFAR